MNTEQAAALRNPFPPEAIGQLPKGGLLLDYVGHAATTDRLLQVDPEWNWEPLALDERGLPALDEAGNLWIRLTVAGTTRLGVGDGPTMKVRIGDAIRNAAMRYGVALDLWAKEDLRADEPVKHPEPVQDAEFVAPADGNTYKVVSSGIEKVEEPKFQAPSGATEPSITDPQRKNIWRLIKKLVEQGGDEEELKAEVLLAYGVTSTTDLSKKEASEVIEGFKLRAGET